jgi:glycosyltransferase involved in cell wall biosynthesis
MLRGSEHHARTVYISLWLPLASETFVYYEAEGLYARGYPVSGFSLYDRNEKELGPRLRQGVLPVEYLGLKALPCLLGALWRGFRAKPAISRAIWRDVLLRRWRDIEQWGENVWAALSAFYLAERCLALGVEHVHAAWANGPATAAWVVWRLTGIPFSMNCLAGDIRPPDGALTEKLAACAFARVDASHNLPYLASFDPQGAADGKHHLVYNVRTVEPAERAAVPMREPLRLLCVGRLVETKGFQYAITAVGLLRDSGLDCRLTVAGSGVWEKKLKDLAQELDLAHCVSFPGFVDHDRVPLLMLEADILLMPCCIRTDTGKGDGLPTVIMEAMTSGLPVVSTNVMGVSDVVRHRETGLLVPERDAEALADAVRQLAENREHALCMANAARSLVMGMFDPDTNLKTLAELFDRHALRSH